MGKNIFKDRLFFFIRGALIISIAGNITLTLFTILRDGIITNREIGIELFKRLEFIFWGTITLILSFGSGYIEKKRRMDIPDILEIIIVIFIYAGLFLSSRFDLYYRFFWWDDLLHTLSGVIIGFIGFIGIYTLNRKYSMEISPLLVALFSFTFAVTARVVWEIMEFSADVIFKSAHQKWNLPDTTIMMGKPYQGSGLRDTMSDLILDCIGAFVTSCIAYFLCKNRRTTVLEGMQRMIQNDEPSL